MFRPRSASSPIVLATLLLSSMLPAVAAGAARHAVDLADRHSGSGLHPAPTATPATNRWSATAYRDGVWLRARREAHPAAVQRVVRSPYQKIDGGYLHLHREIGYHRPRQRVIKRWYSPGCSADHPGRTTRSTGASPVQESGYRFDASRGRTSSSTAVPLLSEPAGSLTYPLNSSGDFYAEPWRCSTTFVRRSGWTTRA